MTAGAISEHNQTAADVWSLGGAEYDMVSFKISDALAHAAQRLAAKPGERVLDVATGTGWTARNVARFGASVVGVDIAEGLLEGARRLSAHTQPPISFERADAEHLPFADQAFDHVISTFGVMFAGDHNAAARELARVCKPGGRLVLATWEPAGAVGDFFRLLSGYQDVPASAGPTPLHWGDPDHVRSLLSEAFDLRFEREVSRNYFDDVDAVWTSYMKSFGPMRALAQSLPDAKLAELKRDLDAYHAKFDTPNGLKIEREYLITIGTRH